jgi:hypothetical protein
MRPDLVHLEFVVVLNTIHEGGFEVMAASTIYTECVILV